MDRLRWAEAFRNIDVSRIQLQKMGKDEFNAKKEFLASCGFAPSTFRSAEKEQNQEEERSIRGEQDEAYENALRETRKMDEERASVQKIEEQREMEKMKNIAKLQEDVKHKLMEVPPEPLNGVRIAFILPSRARITRKFSLETKGQTLHDFVAGQDSLFDSSQQPIEFTMAVGLLPSLDLSKSLGEQGITSPTAIKIVVA